MSGPGIEHATLLLRDTGASNGITASGRNASKQFLVELTDAASIFDEPGGKAAALRLSVRRWRTPQAAVRALASVVQVMAAVPASGGGLAVFSLILANPGSLSGSASVPAPRRRRRFLCDLQIGSASFSVVGVVLADGGGVSGRGTSGQKA